MEMDVGVREWVPPIDTKLGLACVTSGTHEVYWEVVGGDKA